MGNIVSSISTKTVSSPNNDSFAGNETRESNTVLSETFCTNLQEDQFHDTMSEDETRTKIREDEMNEFRNQLNLKREQRREILAKHKSDRMSLEHALEEERKLKLELYEHNRHLRDTLLKNNIKVPENIPENDENTMFKDVINQLTQEMEKQKANNNKLRCDLANSHNALQAAYSEMADLSAQNTESFKQINALKEVVAVSKTLISLREYQLTEVRMPFKIIIT